MKETLTKTTDKKTLYFQALEMAYLEFIEEEKKGHMFTALRLSSKIDAARKLYK